MLHSCRWSLAIGLALVISTSCGARVDLSALEVTDTFTGWYDNGIKDGKNHLVPSVNFRLKNNGSAPASYVQLTVSFWFKGADGEYDAREVTGISGTPVPPGGLSEPILVRASFGYTLEQPRADLFTHSQFRDVTARVIAKRDGRLVRIAEVDIDRRLIPHAAALSAASR
jgi:hypothetical protein